MLALTAAAFLAASPTPLPGVTFLHLTNGMRWLLVYRPGAPRVAGVIAVQAGGVDERPGATGVAHLLEHLAHSGTPMVGAPRGGWRIEQPFHDEALDALDAYAQFERQGRERSMEGMQAYTELVQKEILWDRNSNSRAFEALLWERHVHRNASTDKHRTRYWSDLPAQQLHFWLTLEAQRLAAPVFREFRRERSVVVQELRDRRGRYDAAYERLYLMAFGDSGAGWPVIGREQDVRALAPRDLDDFYARYYGPQAAVGCLVGDFDTVAAVAWIREAFEALPARPLEERKPVAVLPATRAHSRGGERALYVAFPMPPRTSSDWRRRAAVTWLLSGVTAAHGIDLALTGPGRAISSVRQYLGPGEWVPHLFILRLEVRAEASLADAEREWWSALEAVAPTQDELDVVLAQAQLEWAEETSTRQGLAKALAESELMYGSWAVAWDVARLTPSLTEVMRELRTSFRKEDAFVLEVEP